MADKATRPFRRRGVQYPLEILQTSTTKLNLLSVGRSFAVTLNTRLSSGYCNSAAPG
jgi:hypothetical protein